MNSSKTQGPTGPRSIAGKRISSMNALKNGVFAKTPVLPFEDERVYRNHLKDMMSSLDPQDALQLQIAQQIADSMWRGNRQEVRAVVQREDIFKEMTPAIMAGMLELSDERIEHAPDFLVTPNHRFGKKDLQEARKLKGQYEHLSTNVKGIANYNMIWRTYPEFFVELGKWMEQFITPELMMSNNQGLNIAWQQSPQKLEEYIHRYGIYLWYVINFDDMRADIRNWGAIWYFLNGRHSREVEQCDEAVMKERRVCQSLLDTYYKMRKSQVEFAFMRHSELVVKKPQAFNSVLGGIVEPVMES